MLFFSEIRLYILGFDSHYVQSKTMDNWEIFKNKVEILGDAHDDDLQS